MTDSAPPVECPVCRTPAPLFCAKASYGQTWNIHRCAACGHGFVANRPSPDVLGRIYEGEDHLPMDEPGSEAARKAAAERNSLVEMIARLSPVRGDSLDIGSGSGVFSAQLRRMGYRPVMIDLDPRAERAAQYIDGGVFRRSSFEDFSHDRPFAAIVMSQVLEHALSPLDWLRKAQAMLSPGGVLAVALPNFAGVYRLLGTRDPFLIPPIHLNYFTRESLNRSFQAAGLRAARFDSSSRITTRRPTQRFSLKRRVIGSVWNVASRPLDWTTKGIILQGYAVRA